VDKISADFRNGLLEIVAPKAQSAAEAPKQIEISKGS
jgi:HSP20 family molecular chaperone IbpA